MDVGNLSSRQTGTLHAFESYQRKFSDWTCVKRSTLLETDWSQGAQLGRKLIQWSRQAGITSLVPLLPSSSCMCAWRSTPNPPNFGISSAQIDLRSCVLWTCPHSTERSDLCPFLPLGTMGCSPFLSPLHTCPRLSLGVMEGAPFWN